MIEDGYSIDLTPWWRYYAQKFNPFKRRRRMVPMQWLPIETAPTDGSVRIMIAEFRGRELVDIDFDAIQEWEYESWELPQPYLIWVSAFDRVENPTHWCPLPPLP